MTSQSIGPRMTQVLTLREAAAKYGVKVTTLRGVIEAGDLEFIRGGDRDNAPWYVTEQAMKAWLARKAQ